MPFNPATFFSSMKKRFARPEAILQERKDGSQVSSIQPGDPQNGKLGRSSEGAVALRLNAGDL